MRSSLENYRMAAELAFVIMYHSEYLYRERENSFVTAQSEVNTVELFLLK